MLSLTDLQHFQIINTSCNCTYIWLQKEDTVWGDVDLPWPHPARVLMPARDDPVRAAHGAPDPGQGRPLPWQGRGEAPAQAQPPVSEAVPGRARAPGQLHLPRPAPHRGERHQGPGGGLHQVQPQAVIGSEPTLKWKQQEMFRDTFVLDHSVFSRTQKTNKWRFSLSFHLPSSWNRVCHTRRVLADTCTQDIVVQYCCILQDTCLRMFAHPRHRLVQSACSKWEWIWII